MDGYESQRKKAERLLFGASVAIIVAMSMTVAPWLRAHHLPEWLVGLVAGAAVPGAVFFGGRRGFERVWLRLRANRPFLIDGTWELLARKVVGRRRSHESSGWARIVQSGASAILSATTSFSLHVDSLYMSFTGAGCGILVYRGKRRHNSPMLSLDIAGVAEFYLIYPDGDRTLAPIGIFFSCRENRPGALDGGDLVEVVYFRLGMKEQVLSAIGWSGSLLRKAA
ncbi:MAG: hypothetical protein AB7G17_01050 [Phycisphaerales bacterium]